MARGAFTCPFSKEPVTGRSKLGRQDGDQCTAGTENASHLLDQADRIANVFDNVRTKDSVERLFWKMGVLEQALEDGDFQFVPGKLYAEVRNLDALHVPFTIPCELEEESCTATDIEEPVYFPEGF